MDSNLKNRRFPAAYRVAKRAVAGDVMALKGPYSRTWGLWGGSSRTGRCSVVVPLFQFLEDF